MICICWFKSNSLQSAFNTKLKSLVFFVTDMDQCSLGTDNCGKNIFCQLGSNGRLTCDGISACRSTPGSFVCVCPDGYTGDGYTCKGPLLTLPMCNSISYQYEFSNLLHCLQTPMSAQQVWIHVIPMQIVSTSLAHTCATANQVLKEMDNYA